MNEENFSQDKSIRTLTQDMASAIGGEEYGDIKKIISAEETRELLQQYKTKDAKKNNFFIIASLLLLAAAFGVIYFFVTTAKVEPPPPPTPVQFVPLVFTEKSSFVEVDPVAPELMMQNILKEIENAELDPEEILAVYPIQGRRLFGLSKFLETINSKFTLREPKVFDEKFLFGSFSFNQNKNPFLMLKIKSFIDVFKDMRVWEEDMFDDLYTLFEIPVNSENNYLLTKDFEDGIVQNKNARVLYDKNGEVVLMYVFIDDNTIVITASENVVKDLILRTETSKVNP